MIGEAESGEEAVELFDGSAPGLVLMDINLPGHQRDRGHPPHHGRASRRDRAAPVDLPGRRPPERRRLLRRGRLRQQGGVRPRRRPRPLVTRHAGAAANSTISEVASPQQSTPGLVTQLRECRTPAAACRDVHRGRPPACAGRRGTALRFHAVDAAAAGLNRGQIDQRAAASWGQALRERLSGARSP